MALRFFVARSLFAGGSSVVIGGGDGGGDGDGDDGEMAGDNGGIACGGIGISERDWRIRVK